MHEGEPAFVYFIAYILRMYACGLTEGQDTVIIVSFLMVGGITAFAASTSFRNTVIQFITGGAKEDTTDQLLNSKSAVTVGEVTILQNQRLDEHFTATYLSSPNYLDVLETSSGEMLFYTQDAESKERTYYQLVNGEWQTFQLDIFKTEGSVQLGKLPGVMSFGGDTSYSDIVLPEMTFTVEWQQHGEDVFMQNLSNRRFDIGSTFGGTKNGEPLEVNYDGMFGVRAFPGDNSWVQVTFSFDGQRTNYTYPFLYNVHTGEVSDPLAKVDLSAYKCIIDLTISDDKTTATAYAGENHDTLRRITIDLISGRVMDKMPQTPVPDCYISIATSEHTVFYAVGTEEQMSGYIYNTENKETTEIFSDAAWGYIYNSGFADTYVDLIGGNYAAVYKESRNEVYLLNLVSGNMQLLEGITASHDVSFFWNNECSVLAITTSTKLGVSRLAFYIPDSESAWYFNRELSKDIDEGAVGWIGEYGYVIRAEASDGEQSYLYLYEYTK